MAARQTGGVELERDPICGKRARQTGSCGKSGGKPGDAPEMVEGFEMEKTDSQETKTELSSSGVQWFAALFVLLIISLFAAGMGGFEKRLQPGHKRTG